MTHLFLLCSLVDGTLNSISGAVLPSENWAFELLDASKE